MQDLQIDGPSNSEANRTDQAKKRSQDYLRNLEGHENGYEQYEFEDYISDMHWSSIKFIHAIAHNPTINIAFAFDENDISLLVGATHALVKSQDVLKLSRHLESFERMVRSDDRLALKMVQKGLILEMQSAMRTLSMGFSTQSRRKAAVGGQRASHLDPDDEDADAEESNSIFTSQKYCYKTLLRILMDLLSKRFYDFTSNYELPLINPLRYFHDFDYDALILGLVDAGDRDVQRLTFSCLELFILVSEQNGNDDELLSIVKRTYEADKVDEPDPKERGGSTESNAKGHEDRRLKEAVDRQKQMILTKGQVSGISDVIISFIDGSESRKGLDGPNDSISAVSLICALQQKHKIVLDASNLSRFEEENYFDLEENVMFLNLSNAVHKLILKISGAKNQSADETQGVRYGSIEENAGPDGQPAKKEKYISDSLISVLMKFVAFAYEKQQTIQKNYRIRGLHVEKTG